MGPQAANQIVEEIGTQFRARVIQMDEAIGCHQSEAEAIDGAG